jgi:nucleotide-binding universal stress UspA family protein
MIGDRPEVSIDSVVFATDFSPSSDAAGAFARVLASSLPASLTVSHAFLLDFAAQDVELSRGVTSRQREFLLKALAQKAADLSSLSLHAHPVLLDGNPEDVLPKYADEHAPCLLVLGTHGAGPVEHALIGSVAEKVLRSTRWPCLTVGPHVRRPEENGVPFRTILYATDLGPTAPNGALFAIAFAQEFGSSLHVMNVVPTAAAQQSHEWLEPQKHYHRTLERLVPQRANEFCDPHTYVESGTAHDRILDHIRENNVDLLVLGIRKAAHLSIEMRTSGAFRLIADAPCPVLTITS